MLVVLHLLRGTSPPPVTALQLAALFVVKLPYPKVERPADGATLSEVTSRLQTTAFTVQV